MRNYDFGQHTYDRPASRRRVKRKGIKVFAFLLLACVVLPFIVVQYLLNKDEFETKPQTLSYSTSPTLTPYLEPNNSQGLERVVKSALTGTSGKYSVVIKNLHSGEVYEQDAHRQFQAGSLYKLWVLGTAMQQMQEGKLKESEILNGNIEEINKRFDIASDSAELHDGQISLTVKQALDQMITISHNYAALLLAMRVKLTNVDAFLKNHQYTDSKIGQPPKTTAENIARYFEDLYTGKLADGQYTQEMLSLLKRQRLNNKLPKYLPIDTVVAHKTGELGMVSHDAGIIFSEKGDYIIVVLSETTLPIAAEDRIGQISESVYEYFNK